MSSGPWDFRLWLGKANLDESVMESIGVIVKDVIDFRYFVTVGLFMSCGGISDDIVGCS